MGAKTRGNYPHYPQPGMACPACCFGETEHAPWCPESLKGYTTSTPEPRALFTDLTVESLREALDDFERQFGHKFGQKPVDEADFSIQAWPPEAANI